MFKPNYKNIVDCAYNVKPERIPLYEHGISVSIMEKITGVTFAHLNDVDDEAFFKHYCEFFKLAGYDTVTFEAGIVPCLLNGGALTNQVCGSIKTMEDLNEYPFDEILDIFKKYYAPKLDAIRKAMPEGMKAIGGCGYGLFEIVQDLVGFENLCMIKYDDEELYSALFHKCGDFFFECWRYMVEEYSDVFCVFRFGDDLGYKMNTMLPPQDILDYLI